MTPRLRKFVGTIALLALIIVYSLIVMVIGSALLGKFGTFGRTLVYLVGGLAWLPPAMWIVSWMHRSA
jgi:hypothetical protein